MARSPARIFRELLLLLASLLITTVSALNVTRCGRDTTCFVNRCDGKTDDVLALFDPQQQLPPTLDSCQIVLQIKKLAPKRHVVFLRLAKFSLIEQHCLEINIGDSVWSCALGGGRGHLCPKESRPVKEGGHYREPTHVSPALDVHDIRLEVIANSNDFVSPDVMKYMRYFSIIAVEFSTKDGPVRAATASDAEAKLIKEIAKSETCTVKGLSDLTDLPLEEYEVRTVDFSDVVLTCPDGFILTASMPDYEPAPIPMAVYCENKQWQTDIFYMEDDSALARLADSPSAFWDQLDKDSRQHTLTNDLSIGCASKRCTRCTSPPRMAPKSHFAPVVTAPKKPFDCALMTCVAPRVFTENGQVAVNAIPACWSDKMGTADATTRWSWEGTDRRDEGRAIKRLSCKIFKTGAGANSTNSSAEIEDDDYILDPEPDAQKGPVDPRPRRPPISPSAPRNEGESADGTGEWLRRNWIGSILAPVIVVGVVVGCIVFLVFMLRTKDEQDVLLREEQRRRQREEDESWRNEEYDARSPASSLSDDSLIPLR